jgi:hypothetical protein
MIGRQRVNVIRDLASSFGSRSKGVKQPFEVLWVLVPVDADRSILLIFIHEAL